MRHAAALLALLLGDSSGMRNPVDLSRFELLRSFGPVSASTLSPAGDCLAVFSGNDVRIHDVRRGEEVRVLKGHAAKIHDSGWSRDGRVLATAGYDRTVRLWEVATGREISRFEGHPGYT